MGFAELLPVIIPVVVAIIGAVATWLARRVTKNRDVAEIRKLDAEAEEKRVLAKSSEVDIARRLLEDVQRIMTERTEQYERLLEETRSTADARFAEVKERMTELERRERAFIAGLAGHLEWDKAAIAALRAHINDYPEPPPVLPREIA